MIGDTKEEIVTQLNDLIYGDDPYDLSGSPLEEQLRHLCKRLETLGYRYIENETNELSALQYLTDEEREENGSFLEDGTRDFPRGIVQKVSA